MIGTAQTAARLTSVISLVAAMAVITGPVANATSVSAPLSAKSHPAKATSTSTSTTRSASAAASAADYASIFTDANASLADSGWAACAAPIAWTVDSRQLSDTEAAEQVANLAWAFGEWAQASGLTFEYAGQLAVSYDDDAFLMTPADGTEPAVRHVYLDFVLDSDSARLGGGVVGLASPSQVMAAAKEIVAGEAAFRVDHVKSAGVREAKSLYLHELGHVLGLAHAADVANIMYPIVSDHVALGAGDVNGVQSMTKPCTTA
ncbi:MAG: matrixin family metalloprotease [Actinobacteria bacterium]|nr:matrixin family metalloprotease [Actinomycetota bacterium]